MQLCIGLVLMLILAKKNSAAVTRHAAVVAATVHAMLCVLQESMKETPYTR
jgi:hypothetical protein